MIPAPTRKSASWSLGLLGLMILVQACRPAEKQTAAPPTPTPVAVNHSVAAGKVTLRDQGDSGGTQIFIPGTSVIAMTDSRGQFALTGIPPGNHEVNAQHPGFQTITLGKLSVADDFTITSGAPIPENTLEPVPTPVQNTSASQFGGVQGQLGIVSDVEASEEHDYSSARIELEGTPMRTVADASGQFFLWNITPGTYQLSVQMPGYATHRTEIQVAASPDPTIVDVTLSPIGAPGVNDREISGTIELLASDNSRLTDFSPIRVGIRELPARRIKVDEGGTFRIRSIQPGIYTIYAMGEGFEPSEEETLDLTDVPSADVTLTLHATGEAAEATGTIRGTAIKNSPNEADMSGISVALAGTSIVAITDSNGGYRMLKVPPGAYDIVAQAEGYESVKLEGLELAAGQDLEVEDLVLNPITNFPVVLETSPPNNGRDVIVQYEITLLVRFSKKMKPETIKAGVSISPEVDFGVFVNHEHPQAEEEVAVIVINGVSEERPVRFDQSIHVTIADTAEDVEGLRLQEDYVFSFRTGKASIIATNPTSGASQAAVNPGVPLIFQFNARINPESVDVRNIRIKPSIGVVPNMTMITDPRTGWSTLQLQAMWNPDTRYQVTLPRRVKTSNGQYVANTPYTLQFRTSKAYQLTGPDQVPTSR